MALKDEHILIVGGQSMLGAALASNLDGEVGDLTVTTRRARQAGVAGDVHLDLASHPDSWETVVQRRPDVAFLFSAVTSQETCRADPEQAYLINVERQVDLARRLVAGGCRIVFPSTNLVFDGTVANAPADLPYSPVSNYGRFKAEAEERLLDLDGEVVVLRLPKVFSSKAPLLSGWSESMRRGESIVGFTDLLAAPISARLAVQVFKYLAMSAGRGVYQLSARDELPYAALAAEVARLTGASEDLVQAVPSREAGTELEHLPQHVTLDSSRLANEFDVSQPSAFETLREIFGS